MSPEFEDDLQLLVPPKPLGSGFDVDSPEEHFHEQTKYFRKTMAGPILRILPYLRDPAFIARGAAGFTSYQSRPVLSLPSPAAVDTGLGEVLAKRRSVRTLSGSLSLHQVSTAFWHSFAVNHRTTSSAAPKVQLVFRPYPSAGNLNSLEIYALLNKIEGLEPCIVHYDANNHSFRILAAQDGSAFNRVELALSSNIRVAPLVVVIIVVPQRQTQKYGARGYRHAFLEAGHASQNLCLVAQALGLGSLVSSAYFDDELAATLGLDGVSETVGSTILVGQTA